MQLKKLSDVTETDSNHFENDEKITENMEESYIENENKKKNKNNKENQNQNANEKNRNMIEKNEIQTLPTHRDSQPMQALMQNKNNNNSSNNSQPMAKQNVEIQSVNLLSHHLDSVRALACHPTNSLIFSGIFFFVFFCFGIVLNKKKGNKKKKTKKNKKQKEVMIVVLNYGN